MTSREEEFVHELQKSQWFDTTSIVSSQLSRLERLIEHAAKQVPFYASRLTPVLNSSGNGSTSVDLSRWSAVPVLTRDEICANTADLIARSVPAESGSFVVRRSSGTTRRPLEFRRSQLSLNVSNCQLHRLYELYEFDFSKVFAHITRDAAGNCNYPNGLESKGWNIANPDAPVMSLEIRTPPADQLEWLERVRPDYVMTYPNNLRAVAEVALARQSKLRFKVLSPPAKCSTTLRARSSQRPSIARSLTFMEPGKLDPSRSNVPMGRRIICARRQSSANCSMTKARLLPRASTDGWS